MEYNTSLEADSRSTTQFHAFYGTRMFTRTSVWTLWKPSATSSLPSFYINIKFGTELGRRRRRWENNVTMDLRETGREVADLCIWRRTGTSGELLCARW